MADATKARTHTAFALKREGKKFGRWLEIGGARTEKDGSIRVFLDRTPIGGFSGYVHLCPIGTEPPPPPQPNPQRPAPAAGDEEEDFEN
ncbi:MAG TPA: hypothetical protein VMF67_01925 [Rhizomicrobium sp.]|nr:hypothetical protein [Rhizomicrobium sp.]